MTCWVNALSGDEINSLIGDTYAFNAKTTKAYTQVMLQLRRFGSLPFEEGYLARVASCTRRYWIKHVWPAMEDLFSLDDEGRLVHPEVAPLAAGVRIQEDRRSVAGRVAARSRWDRLRLVPDAAPAGSHAQSHAETQCDPHAIASGSHAGSDAIAPPPHAGSHAISHPVASSRAPSPSLSEGTQVIEEERLLEREGERARAPAGDAIDAMDANRMRSRNALPHAETHAPGENRMRSRNALPHAETHATHARGRWRPRDDDPGERIPADWAPGEADRQEARKRGLEPDDVAEAFRSYYLGKGGADALSPDWSARFRVWCRREAAPPQRAAPQMLMPIPGSGAAFPEADRALRSRVARVAAMRGQWSAAPIAPSSDQVRKDGEAAAAWLDMMERWQAGGFRGERPPDYAVHMAAARAA